MRRVNPRSCFQFQNYRSFHNYVRARISDHFASKNHFQRYLPLDVQSRLPKCNRHRTLIHRLEEPVPQLVVNVVKHTDDFLRQFPVFESAFICGLNYFMR